MHACQFETLYLFLPLLKKKKNVLTKCFQSNNISTHFFVGTEKCSHKKVDTDIIAILLNLSFIRIYASRICEMRHFQKSQFYCQFASS